MSSCLLLLIKRLRTSSGQAMVLKSALGFEGVRNFSSPSTVDKSRTALLYCVDQVRCVLCWGCKIRITELTTGSG